MQKALKNKYIYFFLKNDIYENGKIMIIIIKYRSGDNNKTASGGKS